MSSLESSQNTDRLGGRLSLLTPEQLSADQRRLHDRLSATRIRASETSGYEAVLPDGRLIGPFNALLRVPGIAEPQLAWAQAIGAAGIPARVREVVIVTVAADRQAAYVLYAHERAARTAGLPDAVVSALVAGETPKALDLPESLAHRLTLALVREQTVEDALYQAVIEQFGEAKTVALVALIGQYLTTSALVTTFAVPAPGH